MENILKQKICKYCQNENCSERIVIKQEGTVMSYKCLDYIKDESKIIPYQEPLVVTAERDYLSNTEF